MRYLIGIFLLTFVFSCNSNKNVELVGSMDSLNVIFDEAIAKYNKVDSLTVSNIRKKVKSNCLMIKDQNDPIVTSTFIPYSHIDKTLKQILKMDAIIKKESRTSKNQLENLHFDAKEGLIEPELLETYYTEEKEIIMTLIHRMDYNTQQVIIEFNRFDSLNPIIENYLVNQN